MKKWMKKIMNPLVKRFQFWGSLSLVIFVLALFGDTLWNLSSVRAIRNKILTHLPLPFSREERWSRSEELSSQRTAELVLSRYSFEKVFPYDFVENPVDWDQMASYQLRILGGQSLREISTKEQEALSIYQLALEQGWNLARNSETFFLLSGEVLVGYSEPRLKGILQELDQKLDQVELNGVEFAQEDSTIQPIILPAMEFLSLHISPMNPEELGLPDPPIRLDQWGSLSQKIRELVMTDLLENEELIQLAREEFEGFLTHFYPKELVDSLSYEKGAFISADLELGS